MECWPRHEIVVGEKAARRIPEILVDLFPPLASFFLPALLILGMIQQFADFGQVEFGFVEQAVQADRARSDAFRRRKAPKRKVMSKPDSRMLRSPL